MNTHHKLRLAIRPAIAALAFGLFLVPQVAAATPTPTPFSKWGTTLVIDAATGQENIVNGEPEVCDFFFQFDLNVAPDILSWEVRDSSGAAVLKGSGKPDADGKLRQPDSGSLALPNGEYKLVFDDEPVVDSSHGIVHFKVNCTESGGATATPTEAPAQPTPTSPGQEVLPGQGTPTPGGAVAAAHGTPRVTLPPTDTDTGTTGGSSGLAVILAGFALLAAALTLVGGPRYSYARIRRRR